MSERERESKRADKKKRITLLAKSGEVCLEVFRLRSKDEVERLVRKKLRKARRRSQRWGAILRLAIYKQ